MIEWEVLKNKGTGFASKTNTISSGKYFLYRNMDTSFPEKWSGIWAPKNKLFDYFAFKVDGAWLVPEDVEKVTVRPWQVRYAHEPASKELSVDEAVFATDNGIVCILAVTNKSSAAKKINVSLEAAANIRTKHENWHSREYRTEFNDVRKCVRIMSPVGDAVFGIARLPDFSVSFHHAPFYKDHNPGSAQRCYIAGEYVVSLDLEPKETAEIPFIFSKNIEDFDILHTTWVEKIEDMDTVFTHNAAMSNIYTPVYSVNNAYASSQHMVKSVVNNAFFGQGMFAGLPWFLEFWGRDTLWSALGLIDAGEFDTVRNLLRTLATFTKTRVPTLIDLDGAPKEYSADTNPLFLYVLYKYVRATNDVHFAEELKNTIEIILEGLRTKNGLVVSGPKETWMDSIERHGTAVEVQSLWAKAFENQKEGYNIEEQMKSFWSSKDRFLYDTIDGSGNMVVASNALVPLMFGQIPAFNARAMLKRVKSELTSFFGIQTRGSKEAGFNPSGYHTGAVWGLTTGWGACAYLQYDMVSEAVDCLKALAYDVERHSVGSISECVDAKTGALLGCPVQAWSCGLMIHAVDTYLFGIVPDMIKNEISLTPKLPDDWGHMYRNGKKAGKSSFDIAIDRTTYGLKIRIAFDEKNDDLVCRLTLPPEYSKITVKGTEKTKVFDTSKATFRMDEFVDIEAEKANI